MSEKLNRMQQAADRLETSVQKAVTRALDELIPPWCVGIHPDFWKTSEGKDLANALWLVNYREAVSLATATEIVFPFLKHLPLEERKAAGYMKLRYKVSHRLFHYPLPDARMVPQPSRRRQSSFIHSNPYYMLRSDAEQLQVIMQKRHEAIQETYRKKAEREAPLSQEPDANPDA